MQALIRVARAYDTGIEAAEYEGRSEKVLEDRQHPIVVDDGKEDRIQRGQVGDVTGRTTVVGLGTLPALALDKGFPHGGRLIGLEDRFDNGETVDIDFLNCLLHFRGHWPSSRS